MQHWWQKLLWIAVGIGCFWAVVFAYIYFAVGRHRPAYTEPIVYPVPGSSTERPAEPNPARVRERPVVADLAAGKELVATIT